MIKLHGVTLSNYHNTAKLALVEKDIPFEEINQMPSQEPDVLVSSPMGKVPWLEIDGECLSETNVIFDYLEEIKPEVPLYPTDSFARAKAKEIIRVVENYIDLPARRHIGAVYFGGPVDDVAFKEARPALEKGLSALSRIACFAPYIAGMNSLQAWMILKLDYFKENDRNLWITPMMRFFYKNVLWEIGANQQGEFLLTLMTHY